MVDPSRAPYASISAIWHPPTSPVAFQATGLEEENRELKHKMEAMRSSRRVWLPTQQVQKAEKKAPKNRCGNSRLQQPTL
ncbi:UNVERIFIED_CONTAM: hypothetical protein PYX00_006901 [Menopon gallinae]|uniref:Uncharacterized protein n=1 Tax=Menopon gallinae TaxID=328185 RepID=A0AAW2HYR4_9NEOP